MSNQPPKARVSLDLADDDDDLGLDLSAFKPRPAPTGSGLETTSQQALRSASEKQGFHARPETPVAPAAKTKTAKPKPAIVEPILRRRARRKTGRVHQLNVKLTRETIEYVYDLADTRGWIVAEVIEYALNALKATPEGKAKRLRER